MADADPADRNPHLQRPKTLYIPASHDFLRPSRWWFASSAFPMIAGTLGPVASAFSILSLVRPWRQHRPPGTEIADAKFIVDPAWLIALNASQLAVALLSNMFLLLNMARRVPFVVAQPVTIVGWFLSSFSLVALNITGAGSLVKDAGVPRDEIMWSQAFWYGVFAAILYFVVAALMCVTVYGAAMGHYPKDFNLTTAQRTLMLQTIIILLYLLLGALVFSQLQNWSYLDGVYWATVTLFTIGFGDFVATKPVARGLLIPYALVGMISIGLVIGSIRSLVLERGKNRIDSRILEKKRRRLLRELEKKGDDRILRPMVPGEEHGDEPDLPQSELERRKKEFTMMRDVQREASAQHKWIAMATSFSCWLVLWSVGAKIFEMTEKNSQSWTYFDGFYFTFVTLTTLGYGDRTPASNAGKAFFVFWCLLALPTMTIMISNAGDTVARVIRDLTLALGNITILPGENTMKAEIKWFISRLTMGAIFSSSYNNATFDAERENGVGGYGNVAKHNIADYIEDAEGQIKQDMTEKGLRRRKTGALPPPNSANGTSTSTDDSQTEQGSNVLDNALDNVIKKTSTRPHFRSRATILADMNALSATFRHPSTTLPTGSTLYFLLSEEIANVAQHIYSKKVHKYTYEEWTWYLKLIGEDEADTRTHSVARRRVPAEAEGVWNGWSWMGVNSPLFSDKEESEWIVEKLIERLRRELYAETRRKLEEEDNGE